MKIGPLFKWFGSKWQSAKRYPKPEHEHIVEPFAGGAGYSLNHVDKKITIWDADPNLTTLWNWLIHAATSDNIQTIPINVPVGTDIRSLGLSDGQAMLLKHWQRTNNVGDCWTISPWGHLPGQWTENTRARVAEQVNAIKHWEFAAPFRYVDMPVTWFIDPPYLFNYRYRRDLPSFSYDSLVSLVQTISSESLVVVCEARCKKTGDIPGYLPFAPSHSSVTSRRKESQSHHSDELIYVRQPKETP